MRGRLVIVRHGNTFEAGEAPRRVGARTDLPLTATGRAQAEALGERLREFQFTRALFSPLRRTRETAEAILAQQAHPPVAEPASFLIEIDHGPDENQPEDMVLARIGAPALEAWEHDLVPPPGWIIDQEARLAGWRALADDHHRAGGDWLLVTSNGAARFALLAYGLAPERVKLRTGAFGVLGTSADTHYHVIAWDQRP